MTTFVLVHGGWQGGWAFRPLAGILRASGHSVHVVTLTGLGERSHLAAFPINLETHIADVANTILWEDLTDIVLLGHSYGGMVVTGVADRLADRVATLVYLDAVVPEDGDSLISLRPQYLQAFLAKAAEGGGRFIDPPLASARDSDAQSWPELDRKNTPHPFACFCHAISLTGAHRSIASRTFIFANGQGYEGAYDRFRSAPGCQVHGVANAGHSIMIDQPEAVASILLGQA